MSDPVTEADRNAVLDQMAAARWFGRSAWPYLSHAVSRLPVVVTRDVPTMGVSKNWTIYLNPDFCKSLTPYEFALIVFGHEAQHLVLDHAARLEYVTPRELANAGGDLAINSTLREFADAGIRSRAAAGIKDPTHIPIPADALYPHTFGLPAGFTAEQYVDLLKDKAVRVPCPCGSGSGGDPLPCEGGAADREGVTPAEAAAITRRVAKGVIDHAHANGRGTVPGDLARWAGEYVAPPKVDWRQKLRAAIRHGIVSAGKDDYSWKSRSRRDVSPLRLPGMVLHKPVVAGVLDTSGSMTQADLDAALSEARGVVRAAGAGDLRTVVCDAASHGVVRIGRATTYGDLTGGGGTDMRVGIAAACALKPRPGVVIVFTDGDTPWPDRPPPGVTVVACLTRRHAAPPPWVTTVYAGPAAG